MTDYQIPISYVVQASAVPSGAGLAPLQMGTILVLTESNPIGDLGGDYMIARNASSVLNAFGSDVQVTKMAQAAFGQNPNVLAAGGYLIVAPYKTLQQATSGVLTTADLTASNWTAVENGALDITVDGVKQEVRNLNFAGDSTVGDIAATLQASITGVSVAANGNKIVITSNSTGASSSVAVSAIEGASGLTDLYGTNYLNGAAVIVVAGQSAGAEKYVDAINRMASKLYFNGVTTDREVTDEEAIAASAQIQSMQDRILVLPANNVTALSDNSVFNKLASNYFTRKVLYTKGTIRDAQLFAIAYMSRLMAVNYSGSNTTLTMNLKDLAGIEADTNISETILDKCKTVGVDVFPSVEGLAKVMSFKQGNQYSDQVTNQIWFKTTIQRDVFNVLATTRTKIPQTEPGITKITNAIRLICKQAVTNGMLAPGQWNSPDTFGNLEDFYRNISEVGYYIYHQPVVEQLQSEREERKAPAFQIAAKEAGAVHSANIMIYLEA